jgi:hypothetical protein
MLWDEALTQQPATATATQWEISEYAIRKNGPSKQ